eukprot:ANDGO_06670.mRNA.1 hypothetical protein
MDGSSFQVPVSDGSGSIPTPPAEPKPKRPRKKNVDVDSAPAVPPASGISVGPLAPSPGVTDVFPVSVVPLVGFSACPSDTDVRYIVSKGVPSFGVVPAPVGLIKNVPQPAPASAVTNATLPSAVASPVSGPSHEDITPESAPTKPSQKIKNRVELCRSAYAIGAQSADARTHSSYYNLSVFVSALREEDFPNGAEDMFMEVVALQDGKPVKLDVKLTSYTPRKKPGEDGSRPFFESLSLHRVQMFMDPMIQKYTCEYRATFCMWLPEVPRGNRQHARKDFAFQVTVNTRDSRWSWIGLTDPFHFISKS